jgi:sec-independent protein translocase protein TatC
MSLGAHLDELRRRLIWVCLTIGVVFVVGFAFEVQLKQMMVRPLRHAIGIIGEQVAIKVQLIHSHQEFLDSQTSDVRCLVVQSVAETTATAVKVSVAAGIALALPVLLYHIWRFVAVGLTTRERKLGFLFLPFGVFLFYVGAITGYFFGLPWFFAWLIEFTARDNVIFQLRQSEYVDDFITWTLTFGLIMDIPWLVMVLVRTGILKIETIAKSRKYVVAINFVLTCCMCPATDIVSLSAMFIPVQLLFEAGLFVSRFLKPKPPAEDAALSAAGPAGQA